MAHALTVLKSCAAKSWKHSHNGTFATPNQVHLSRWTTRLMEWHVPSQPGRNRFKPDLTCMGLPACGHNASTAALFTVPGWPLVHSKGKPPTIDLTVPAIKINECCCNWWRLSTTSEMSCRAPPTHVQYVNLEWLAKTSSHKSPTYYTYCPHFKTGLVTCGCLLGGLPQQKTGSKWQISCFIWTPKM